MEKIYIRAYYLKTVHYFFFSLSVFSLTMGMMFFDPASIESLISFGSSFFYCGASLAIAYHFYRNYKETMDAYLIIKAFALPYVAIVLFTVIMVTSFALFFPFIFELMYSFLFVNFYIFFMVAIGFVLSRFKVVTRFFSAYGNFAMGRGKAIAEQYAIVKDIKDYEIGKYPELDETLDEIWNNRDYPLRHVRVFERKFCEYRIVEINRSIEYMKKRQVPDKGGIMVLENAKKNFIGKIAEIDEKQD